MDANSALTIVDIGLGATACIYLVVAHFRMRRMSRRITRISVRVGVLEETPPHGTKRLKTQPED